MVKVNGLGCVVCHPSHTCSVFTALNSAVPLAPPWWETGRCWVRDEVVGSPVREPFGWTRREVRRGCEIANLHLFSGPSGHCFSVSHIDISQCSAIVSMLTFHAHLGNAGHSLPWPLASILNSPFQPDSSP